MKNICWSLLPIVDMTGHLSTGCPFHLLVLDDRSTKLICPDWRRGQGVEDCHILDPQKGQLVESAYLSVTKVEPLPRLGPE